jgi:hypothetical protein
MKRRNVVDIIKGLEAGRIPLYKVINPIYSEVKLPSYDGPFSSPVRHLTPEEYFRAKEEEKQQTLASVLVTK